MAAAGPSSARALALYRRIMRAARTWKGPAEERSYIESTAREEFRRDRSISPAEASAKLTEAEQRVELAIHYGIAYPRLHHSPAQFKGRAWTAPQVPPAFGGSGRRQQ